MTCLISTVTLGSQAAPQDFAVKMLTKPEQLLGCNLLAILHVGLNVDKQFIEVAISRLKARTGAALVLGSSGTWSIA